MKLFLDGSWTLFLDRDGVINKRRIDQYLARWEDFDFLDRADLAIVKLRNFFKRIIVVTNQQGVAKGLTTSFEIDHLHYRLERTIKERGGHIDKIYYCPHHEMYQPLCRKPRPGMALQAKEDFADIDFSKSVIVGDFYTDIEMGHVVGMKTIFINNDGSEWHTRAPEPDYIFPSLFSFAEAVEQMLIK